MRIGKASTLSPASGSEPSDAVDSSVKRRQSFTSAVTALAAELHSRPKKSGFTLPRLRAAHKSTDNLSLANAARSKSCPYLPATAGDEPLLTLVLSSTSFLDATISENGGRLYVIDTKGARTNVAREDPAQGIAHVGAVTWVDDNDTDRPIGFRSSATIQMAHGRRYYAEEFLKRAKLTSSRLFNIPHYPHTLKWKRSGSNYKLTAAKGKTTIAILEPPMLAAPPRIKVFEALYEHDVTRPQREHRGVPVFLLDYMVVTAMLIVAEKDEWLHTTSGTASSASAYSASYLGGQSPIQKWRLEVQTEPFAIPRFGSQPPSPSVPPVIDIGPSRTEAGSGSGTDVADYRSSSQARHSSHMLTSSSESFISPGRSFPHSSAPSARGAAHPFATELIEGEDIASPVDEFGMRVSPLATVLPPVLGISLVDSSPRPVSSIPSPESAAPYARRSRMRTWSVESLVGVETRLQMSKSLPVTPTTRPSTAGSLPRDGSRPFRPLPKPPQGAATLLTGNATRSAEDVPPVPNLPSGIPFSGHADGLSAVGIGGRPSGSRVVSLSSVSISLSPRSSTVGMSGDSTSPNSEFSSAESGGHRSVRRSASETTLSARAHSEMSSEGHSHMEGAARHEQHRHNPDISLLKTVHRRSILKHSLSSESPLPNRTLSASAVSTMIPHTAPLRIRNARTTTQNYDSALRASTSSSMTSSSSAQHVHSISHSQFHAQSEVQDKLRNRMRPSVYARPQPQDILAGDVRHTKVGEDEDIYECSAPPAYDSIDFSHPPLKQTTFREIG